MLHKDKKVPLNEPYLGWPSRSQMTNSTLNHFTTGTHPAGEVSYKGLVASFFILSFLFQTLPAIIPPVWKWLVGTLLERNVQPLNGAARVSSTVMARPTGRCRCRRP